MWNKTDPRDKGGNRRIVISDGKYAWCAEVWAYMRQIKTVIEDDEDRWKEFGKRDEWPNNLRWTELPPKEDEG
jgi:hypothetical protein